MLSLSVIFFKSVNDKVTSKVDLVHFVRLATTLLKVEESARQIFTDLIFFHWQT